MLAVHARLGHDGGAVHDLAAVPAPSGHALAGHVSAGDVGKAGQEHVHAIVLDGSSTLSPLLTVDLPMWALMCVAMMVPAALPAIHHVGVNSLRWRRQRAIATFLLAYLSVWWAFGLVVLPAVHLLDDRLPRGQLTMATALLSAAWLVSPPLVFFRRACHLTVPLPPRGRRAVAGCVRFGLRHGLACVGVCGPLMLLTATLLHGPVIWMVLLTTLVLANKRLPRGRRPGVVQLPLVAIRRPFSRAAMHPRSP
jgi:predicted metal-binding membrane protein